MRDGMHLIVQNEATRAAANVAAPGLLITSMLNWLSPTLTVIATIMAIIWYSIQFYESPTGQSIIAWFKSKL